MIVISVLQHKKNYKVLVNTPQRVWFHLNHNLETSSTYTVHLRYIRYSDIRLRNDCGHEYNYCLSPLQFNFYAVCPYIFYNSPSASTLLECWCSILQNYLNLILIKLKTKLDLWFCFVAGKTWYSIENNVI